MGADTLSIGVIGWWNHDNAGDNRILASLRAVLAPHRVVPLEVAEPLDEGVLRRFNLLDYLILGGAGVFQRGPCVPFDTFHLWGSALHTPIGVIGLGIDEVLDSHRSALRALAERAEFFSVRDRESQRLVAHPKVNHAADVSFLRPLQVAARPAAVGPRRPLCGVNLRRGGGLDVAAWCEAVQRLPLSLRAIPLSSYPAFGEAEILPALDAGCAAHFSEGLYQGLDVMVGTAYHSVLFAVQAAVPVVAIAYAPKVRRFMEDAGLGNYVLGPGEHARLPDLVARALGEGQDLREKLLVARAELVRRAGEAAGAMRAAVNARTTAARRARTRVSIIVLPGGDAEHDARTLESCLGQTHAGTEVLVVGQVPSAQAAPAERVTRAPSMAAALAAISGDYVSWIEGGNQYAPDAVAYLADHLDGCATCDVAYAAFYSVDEQANIQNLHRPVSPDKLYRRDVVGPCFLVRRGVLRDAEMPRLDAPQAAYGLWLRAWPAHQFAPLSAPLMYVANGQLARYALAAGRATRRAWRRSWPWPRRAFWNVMDTATMERVVVQPALRAGRAVAGVLRRGRTPWPARGRGAGSAAQRALSR